MSGRTSKATIRAQGPGFPDPERGGSDSKGETK